MKKSGYDILRVDEVKRGMKDLDVLNLSVKERRALITFDKDFGELIVKEKTESMGVILLRIHPESINFIKEKIFGLLEKVSNFEGKFITVEEDRIRERLLKNFIR